MATPVDGQSLLRDPDKPSREMEGDDLGIFLGRNTTRTLRILAKMDAAAFAARHKRPDAAAETCY